MLQVRAMNKVSTKIFVALKVWRKKIKGVLCVLIRLINWVNVSKSISRGERNGNVTKNILMLHFQGWYDVFYKYYSGNVIKIDSIKFIEYRLVNFIFIIK